MPMVFSVTRAWSFTPAPVVCIRCGAGLTCLKNTRFAFASFEVSWPCPCPIRFISCFSIRIFGLCKNFRFILRSICVNCFMKLTSSRRTLTYDVGQIAPKKNMTSAFSASDAISCSCCSARSRSSCIPRPPSTSNRTVCTSTRRTAPPATPSTCTTRATSSTTAWKTCLSHQTGPNLRPPRSPDSKVRTSRRRRVLQKTEKSKITSL